jgi:hypothetical protein
MGMALVLAGCGGGSSGTDAGRDVGTQDQRADVDERDAGGDQVVDSVPPDDALDAASGAGGTDADGGNAQDGPELASLDANADSDAADADAATATEGAGGSDADAASATNADAVGTGNGDADSADVGSGDAASDGASSEVGVSASRTLSLVVFNAPWKGTQRVQGMAVDAQSRVFLEDQTNVYMFDGKTVTTYLTLAETTASTTVHAAAIKDLDIDANGLLYVLMWGGSNYSPTSTLVVRSSAAHVADPWLDVTTSSNFALRMSVSAPGHVGLVDRDGFKLASAAGSSLLYSHPAVEGGSGCTTEDLRIGPSGVFLYEPGCNGAPLLRGNVDGSGVGVLYQGTVFQAPPSPYTPNFTCLARDPAGGFYVMVGAVDFEAPNLYHVTEDASGTHGLELIDTVPTFSFAAKTQSETFAFDFCSLAVGPDGAVYYQTYSQLWKVSP